MADSNRAIQSTLFVHFLPVTVDFTQARFYGARAVGQEAVPSPVFFANRALLRLGLNVPRIRHRREVRASLDAVMLSVADGHIGYKPGMFTAFFRVYSAFVPVY